MLVHTVSDSDLLKQDGIAEIPTSWKEHMYARLRSKGCLLMSAC